MEKAVILQEFKLCLIAFTNLFIYTMQKFRIIIEKHQHLLKSYKFYKIKCKTKTPPPYPLKSYLKKSFEYLLRKLKSIISDFIIYFYFRYPYLINITNIFNRCFPYIRTSSCASLDKVFFTCPVTFGICITYIKKSFYRLIILQFLSPEKLFS